jgi:hypothetical protein
VRELPLSQKALGGPPTFSPRCQPAGEHRRQRLDLPRQPGRGPVKQILARNCTPENCLFSTDLLGWVP